MRARKILLMASLIALGLAPLPACVEEEKPPPPPQARFTFDVASGTAPLVVRFTDESSSDSAITSLYWDFGDGNGAEAANPVHTYTRGGVYTVSLTVTSAGGSDTEVMVDAVDVGQFTVDFAADVTSGPAPLQVIFTDLTAFTGTLSNWSWDFGDGARSSDPNPTHTYTLNGTYPVSLTVTGSLGSDTAVKSAYIHVESLDAEFSVDVSTGTAPLQVRFTDQTTTTGTIGSWAWNFGDGTVSNLQNPVHAYASAGSYSVSLTVTTAHGSDTETKAGLITVSAPVVGKPTNGSGGATGSVTGTYNGRSFRLWVPASYSDSSPVPIVVGMHGLGDT
ncbi:MAG: PKD domain-containing protein, partial [Planctomycetota bacterium]